MRVSPQPSTAVEAPEQIAALAVRALRVETLLTPKPGLVDRNGPGSHDDMDLPLLLRSADSLAATFADLALLGRCRQDCQSLRDRVGVLGRVGEAAMLHATGGVNTHRGALWTVGLLVTAAGSATSEDQLFLRAAMLAGTPDSAAAPTPWSHGQHMVRAYGVAGAVGEASAGFPSIVQVALPVMRACRSRHEDDDRAQLRALLALMATVDDTCVLHRGGMRRLRWMQRSARRVQTARRFEGALDRFDRRVQRRRLSPGGSADLLAGAVFVDSLNLARTAVRRCPLQEPADAHP